MNNLIWTDMVANTLIGTDTVNIASVAAYEPSLSYDFRYSIPAFISVAIWLPVFLSAVIILLTGALRMSHVRYLLTQISVGRIVVGDSALTALNSPGTLPETGSGRTSHFGTTDWARTTGRTLVVFEAPGTRAGKGFTEQAELLAESDVQAG